jgi:uncharacterized protein (TIGR02172 family)
MNAEQDKLVLSLTGRIDTNNAAQVEKELMTRLEDHPGKTVVLDAAALEYISSAGLRVLMKLRKRAQSELSIVDVSPEVYEILEVTGFMDLFHVRKRMREVSVEGLPLIGAGANGKVYRLDGETIIKVYNPITNPPEKILGEKQAARQAFIHDIPSAISFDVVRVGDSLGIVYEMIDANTLGVTIREAPEKLEEYAVRMAALLKKLHSTTFEPGTLPDARNGLHAWADVAARSGRYLPETITKLRALIDSIPPQNTFIHGDFHPANIMVSGEEWLLIDMGDASVGHPVIDLLGTYQLMKLAAERGDGAMRYTGIPAHLLSRVWDIFLRTYLGTDDPQALENVEKVLKYYAIIRSLPGVTFSALIPDAARGQVTQQVQAFFLQAYDTFGSSLLRQLPL